MDPTTKATEAERHAFQELSADAFHVCADAWEEVSRHARARSMRIIARLVPMIRNAGFQEIDAPLIRGAVKARRVARRLRDRRPASRLSEENLTYWRDSLLREHLGRAFRDTTWDRRLFYVARPYIETDDPDPYFLPSRSEAHAERGVTATSEAHAERGATRGSGARSD